MRIGSAARVLDVHPDTIRRLDRLGVLTFTRDWRGHRRFTNEDLARLRAILYPAVSEANDALPGEEREAEER